MYRVLFLAVLAAAPVARVENGTAETPVSAVPVSATPVPMNQPLDASSIQLAIPEIQPEILPDAAALGEAGQPLPALTLAELEALALRCNPTIAQNAARVEAARGLYVQAGLYPNPVSGYVGSEIGNDGRSGQQGGFLSQEIITSGKLQRNRDVAQQEIRKAEFLLQAQQQRVLTDVRQMYYDVLIAQRALCLSQELVQIGDQGVQSTESLLKAQEVARGDVLQAAIEADSARMILMAAQNRHAAAWRSLTAVIGCPKLCARPLAGNPTDGLVDLCWEDALCRLLTCSPELAAAKAGVARAQATVNREIAVRTPNLELQGAVQRDAITRSTFANVQVGLPLPLFNRNQGNICKAEADLLAAQKEVRRTEFELQQRLATVFEQYANARFQVAQYDRQILPKANDALKLISAGYQQGEYSYLSMLTAQRTFFHTNLRYLDALRELRLAATAIEGNLLNDSLETGAASLRGGQANRPGTPTFFEDWGGFGPSPAGTLNR